MLLYPLYALIGGRILMYHVLNLTSVVVLSRINRGRGHRTVRMWFDAYGHLVGVWQGRNGRTYAVGHNGAGKTIVYRTGDVQW